MTERARKSLAGGVASSWQATDPHPIYLAEGQGSQGHRRRRQRVRRLPQRLRRHGRRRPRPSRRSSRPSPTAVARGHALRPADRGRSMIVGEHLQQRFGLPLWRFCNSGTEATLDAVRLMRAIHRPRHPAQDRGLLPRPPRLADGLGRAARATRSARYDDPGVGAADARASRPTVAELDARRAVQRPRRARAHARAATRAGRRHDRRAGDDERRLRPARGRLPGGRQGAAARRTARCSRSTR